MTRKAQQLKMIKKRFHQKVNDIAILKMHIVRDEQDIIKEFIDEVLDTCDDGYHTVEEMFKGPNFNIRYILPQAYEDELDDLES